MSSNIVRDSFYKTNLDAKSDDELASLAASSEKAKSFWAEIEFSWV